MCRSKLLQIVPAKDRFIDKAPLYLRYPAFCCLPHGWVKQKKRPQIYCSLFWVNIWFAGDIIRAASKPRNAHLHNP